MSASFLRPHYSREDTISYSEPNVKAALKMGEGIRDALAMSHTPQGRDREIVSLLPIQLQAQFAKINLAKVRVDLAESYERRCAHKRMPLSSALGCSCCTTLIYASVVALIGLSISASDGVSIPAVLAASGYSIVGLATVISALTGATVGAVTGLLTARGATLGLVVIGLCEAMGAC